MTDHPSKEELSGFLLGKLAAESCDVVADHLEQCSPCQQTIQSLESNEDTLLAGLRQPSPVQADARSQEVVEKIAALVPQASGSPPVPAASIDHPADPPRPRPVPPRKSVPTREVFEQSLLTSGVIDDDEWTRLLRDVPELGSAADAVELGNALVQQGVLTEFQAAWLSEGKSGLRMGEYVLLDQIGAGGMGQVFKARHRRMNRIVALKVLAKSAMNSPEAVKRFQREVQAAAKLNHPNIVTAHDAGEQDGVHFLVMEYVAGQDLSALLKQQGALPVDTVISYLIQAARGLAFAHSKGIVHRDIKPANLLLDAEGTVKILDLGLARFDGDPTNLAAQDGLTQSGQVMGTVEYMAPEQAYDTRTADAKADVYSLGCTLYRLISGRNAFDGETLVQKILAHRDQPIPSLAAALPGTPARLDAIYQRMMAKKPADRPTMAELLQVLESLAQPVESSALSITIATPKADGPNHTVVCDEIANADHDRQQPDGGRRNGRRPLVKWIAAATAAFSLIAFAVWFIIRDKNGNEIARVKGSDGSSVTMQADPPDAAIPVNGTTPTGVPSVQNTQPAPAIAPFNAATARKHQEAWAKHLGTTVETTNSVGAKMVLIPPGEFLMGSSDEQVKLALAAIETLNASDHFKQDTKERIEKAERPQHRVVLTKPFFMGATEVTIGQFKKFADAAGYQTAHEKWAVASGVEGNPYFNPGYPVTDESPAAKIALPDIVAYCRWLTLREKAVYRLPTEAEWEYACRAGTTTQYSFGDNEADLEKFAWSRSNSRGRSHQVGTKLPNAFGLFDMHGNLQEWCEDWYEKNWYETSPLNDPTGPTVGGMQNVLRGGSWQGTADWRSAYRHYSTTPGIGYHHLGFRIVRTIQKPTNIDDPAFHQWMNDVAALPAEEQIKAVTRKLIEQNPKFDGLIEGIDGGMGVPRIKDGVVTEFGFFTNQVTDIAPLRALTGLKVLALRDVSNGKNSLWDLSPLQGMNLNTLYLQGYQISDISPLQGMPLTKLTCEANRIVDLSPLEGMPLTDLALLHMPVSDLSPLKGMKLTSLNCYQTQVSDLSPLRGMPLTSLDLGFTPVSDLSPLQGMTTLTKLLLGATKVADLSKLQWTTLTNLTRLDFSHTKVSDLSPLKGVPLIDLDIDDTQVSDLSPLQGMPLNHLNCLQTRVTDLSPLKDLPLERLDLDFNPERDAELLRSIKTLQRINNKPVAEFWKEVDKQKGK